LRTHTSYYFGAADIFIGIQTDYGDVRLAYQLIRAIDFTQSINSNKYNFLEFAFIALTYGIALTYAVALTILQDVL
jgi:hypothetical protein